MKNPSLAILVMVPILIISIGMYAYTSSQSVITDSTNNMNTQEIEAFNTQFTIYGGAQTGVKIKSLMGTLIANANTYREEPNKMPEVTAEIVSDEEEQEINTIKAETPKDNDEESLEEYINNLSEIRSSLDNKYEYNVSFEYSSNGVLNGIVIER